MVIDTIYKVHFNANTLWNNNNKNNKLEKHNPHTSLHTYMDKKI